MAKIFKALRDPGLVVVLLMGFSSGIPLLLIGGTMKGWLADEGIKLSTIGLFAFVGLPYTLKFLWAPFMDRFVPPFGRRRGWLMITQVGVIASIFSLSLVDPVNSTFAFACTALVVAFFSASQDVVVDAYRREVLTNEMLGLGSSLYVLGYRLALYATGAGAFILASRMSWEQTYICMAALGLGGEGYLSFSIATPTGSESSFV